MAPMKCPPSNRLRDEFGKTWTLTHVAHRWGVRRRTIRQLLAMGELPFVQVEGQIRVPVSAVRKFETR